MSVRYSYQCPLCGYSTPWSAVDFIARLRFTVHIRQHPEAWARWPWWHIPLYILGLGRK